MVRRGARHLVLSSRSGPREEASRDIEQLRAAGITVVDARCDVTNCDDVTRLVRQIRDELPPLKGVIHGAMVLDDEFLAALDETRFRKALDPKMLGAWNLHAATQDLDLDHFIGFSSFSSVIGGPKQSNYNAGNYLSGGAGPVPSCPRSARRNDLPGASCSGRVLWSVTRRPPSTWTRSA